ncbi:MAG: SGNH/GDSL hydrolase family protein [Pararhizobium sp.]
MTADRMIRIAAAALMCLAAVSALSTGSVRPATAQERVERGSILDFFFGRRRQAYPEPPPAPRRARRPRTTRSRSAPASAPAASAAPDEPQPVEKRDDARTVLVVGDFMASGLADGLTEAFAQSPGVVIDDETNGSSGLVRQDYYNWSAEIGAIIDQAKPAAVVVLIGSNDRQQMTVAGNREPVRSDAWTAEYTRRAEALAKAITAHKVPLVWVGVPAFQSPSMSADILAFDGIFRTVATNAGGDFVDPWDGFVDDSGQFIFTGSDINGQPVRLRGPDGINLTAAGKRKLAFYAEKPLHRILGDAADKAIAALSNGGASGPDGAKPKPPSEIVRTEPIALNDPSFDGDTALLGGGTPPPVDPRAPRTLLVKEGRIIKPPAGRADAARWDPEPDDRTLPAEKPGTGGPTALQSGPPTPSAATPVPQNTEAAPAAAAQ